MDDGSVELTVADNIATVTFGHPKGNSLPGVLLRRMAAAIDAAAAVKDASVVVLRSTGTGPFCAGASFDELKAISSEGQGLEFFSGFAHVINAMRRCPKFIVTRVHGKVAGGGVGLVAASDYAIAVPTASARLSELAVGIGPFVVGVAVEYKIGRAHFSAMSVDHDWKSAEWCERAGLYARLVAVPGELDDAVHALAVKLAACNPDAMRELKRIFWAETAHWDTELVARAAISGRLVLSDYTKRAIAAFGG